MKPIHVVGLVRAKLREATNAKLDALGLDFGPDTYSIPYVRPREPRVIVAYGFGPAACTRQQARALRTLATNDGLEGVRLPWSADAQEPADGQTVDDLAARYGLVRYTEDLRDGQQPPPPPTREQRDAPLDPSR